MSTIGDGNEEGLFEALLWSVLSGARSDAFNWLGVGLDLNNGACWFKETLGFDSTRPTPNCLCCV